MDKYLKLNTAIRMHKVALKAVDAEYANSYVADYKQGSKLSKALYRADQLCRIIDNTSHDLGLV
jgi:hypothetical protein